MFENAALREILNFWTIRLGDHYILSWPSTVLYACTLVAAIYRVRRLRQESAPRNEQIFWFFLIFMVFVLGINKQLNFHVLLIDAARHAAHQGGWFEKRRLVQEWFAYALSGVIAVAAVWVLWSVRTFWRAYGLAFAGLIMLCGFTILRASLLNHIGFLDYLKTDGDLRVTDVIEFAGILCVFAGCLIRARR